MHCLDQMQGGGPDKATTIQDTVPPRFSPSKDFNANVVCSKIQTASEYPTDSEDNLRPNSGMKLEYKETREKLKPDISLNGNRCSITMIGVSDKNYLLKETVQI